MGDARPSRAYADGHEIALFRDASGKARAVEDRCPHRRVPLTLGKVVDGAIRCAYHGWTFDGTTGSCIAVPNLGDDERVSPNFCVRAYSCSEHNGFIYAWTGSEDPHSAHPFQQVEAELETVFHTSGSGIASLAYGHYLDALVDGPQVLFAISGVRITDFFLGDAVVDNGRLIIDREAEWGDQDSAPALKITDRPMVLRTELLEREKCAIFRLFDDQYCLLAEILLSFTGAPRGCTAFCWRFRQFRTFRALQPWHIRARYGNRKPIEVHSRIDGRALANLLVGPSHDLHQLTDPVEA